MKWNEISAIPVPEYRVVMLYREHDLYPVVGWYLPEGVFILEEGGTEDDPIRRHPALTWRPTHWAELPLLPSDHEHRSAELAAVVAPDPSRSSGGCREGVDVAESISALATLARFAALKGARVWVESVPADELSDESWLVELRGLSLPSDGCPGRYNTTAEKAAADILAEIWQEESVFHALA